MSQPRPHPVAGTSPSRTDMASTPAPLRIDEDQLRSGGFVVVPEVIDPDWIDSFDETISRLCAAELARKGIAARSDDPLIDLLTSDQAYREALFPLLKHLQIVTEAAARIGRRLDADGYFGRWGFRAPAVWPSVRADLPGESTYLLPVHQDYATMRCHNAYRFWVPLRDADAECGTLAVYPGTHRGGAVAHDVSDPAYPCIPADRVAGHEAVTLELPAGHGVLIDPLLWHASVPAVVDRVKYVLMLQIQDLATVIDPTDRDDRTARIFGDVKSGHRPAAVAPK